VTDYVVISTVEREQDPASEVLFTVPVQLLDPSHPQVSPEARIEILRARYHQQMIADGIETGHFAMDANGQLSCRTRLPLPSFLGFMFEAFLVNAFNTRMSSVGRAAFEWCSNRERTRDEYIKQFKAVGTGFISTSNVHPHLHAPQSNLDIVFVRKRPNTEISEPALVLGTTLTAGIQVKAIRGNERQEIVDPILAGSYSRVITVLDHEDGIHSRNVCVRIAQELYRQGTITLDQMHIVERSVLSPEMIGLDQREINDYYQYVSYWYQGRANTDQLVSLALGMEVKSFKYGPSGLLVPV